MNLLNRTAATQHPWQKKISVFLPGFIISQKALSGGGSPGETQSSLKQRRGCSVIIIPLTHIDPRWALTTRATTQIRRLLSGRRLLQNGFFISQTITRRRWRMRGQITEGEVPGVRQKAPTPRTKWLSSLFSLNLSADSNSDLKAIAE